MAKDKKSKKAVEDAEEDVAEPAQDHDGKNDKAKKKKKKGVQDEDDENGAPLDEVKAPVIEEDDDDDAGGKKGKKKRRKRRDDDDEDLEKALAELQLEHEGKKPVGEANETSEAAEAKPKEGKKKEKAKKKEEAVEEAEADDADESTVKSAAQKRKEKKERQKQKPKGEDSKATEPAEPKATETKAEEPQDEDAAEDEGEGDDDKKKKKKKKGKDEKEDDKKKGGKKPNKMMVAAMQEALRRVQEEEEKARLAEEEKQRLLEEAQEALAEKKRLEEERRALRKQREKDKKEELRKAGLLLTAKQKADKARAEAMIEAMRAQGVDVPLPGEKRAPRPGTRVRTKKGKAPEQKEGEDVQGADEDDKSKEEEDEEDRSQEDDAQKSTEDAKAEAKASWEDEDEEDDVKESWDAEEEEKEKEKPPVTKKAKDKDSEAEESEDESSSEESDSEDSGDSSDSEESERDEAVKVRETALARIAARKEENEKKRTTDVLRAPVVCVLGHVDTGKTKILDKLRRTNVQDNEAGGITQQIGATNVPIEVIKEQCKMVKNLAEGLILPGLLIIDTPGHESFSNLRDRGSSLCDIAILVVDIMHCLEPQTIESINLLKKKKTPFVIALNKIDRLYEWKSNRHKDVQEVIESQTQNTKLEFVKRSQEVITAMAEQGLNAALFYENPDPKTYVSMVPTSAHSGDGMGNLMGLLVQLSQTMLAKRLAYSDELQATVLEVKAIPGMGTTIDIVLVNGTLKEGQTMVLAGTDGAIVTQIKALLTPSKMQDLRVSTRSYVDHKELRAAQGVKIAAKDLDKAIAGLNLLVAHQPDEVEVLKEEMQHRLQSALTAIKLSQRGVFVQASTLGSLEALLEFLKTSKIPYAGVKIGPVVKRDVMTASVMLEHEEKYTVILAFDVKVERDAQDMADNLGVKIFQADIIYHLFDRFTAFQEELKARKREEFKHQAVFPCKLRFLPNLIFNSRSPIVAGVVVEAGTVRKGTPLCVPSKEFLEIGIVTSIESNHKEVESAKKGEEVCIKIDPLPGESPKMFGRHFDEKDIVMSKISRLSIDVCKEHFRDDLQKSDWALMVELKKVFQIL